MISRWSKAGASILLAIALAACGNMVGDRNDQGGNGTTTKGAGDRQLLNGNGMLDRNNGRGTNNATMHNNTRMDIDEQIAQAVADLGEVDMATVLVTDKNAYVAVMLDNAGNDNGNGNMNGNRNGNGIGNVSGNDNGNISRNDNGRINGNGNGIGNGMRAMDMNTRGTKNNGKVNTRMDIRNEGDNLTDDLSPELKRRIADTVKKQAPHIRNVYVSANPDFVGTMRGYGDQVRNGHPLRGAIIEFNRMVERVFPDNAER